MLIPDEVKAKLPKLISFLLSRHGDEWVSGDIKPKDIQAVASAACQWRQDKGFYLFLRTWGMGAERLVAARVLVDSPTQDQWSEIREERTSEGPDNIGSGRYRYVFVPDELADEAREALRGSEVRVVALSEVDA